jgi:hypothetical protein
MWALHTLEPFMDKWNTKSDHGCSGKRGDFHEENQQALGHTIVIIV